MAAYPKKIELEPILTETEKQYRAMQAERWAEERPWAMTTRGLSRQIRILAEVLVDAINDANHHNGHDSAGED